MVSTCDGIILANISCVVVLCLDIVTAMSLEGSFVILMGGLGTHPYGCFATTKPDWRSVFPKESLRNDFESGTESGPKILPRNALSLRGFSFYHDQLQLSRVLSGHFGIAHRERTYGGKERLQSCLL